MLNSETNAVSVFDVARSSKTVKGIVSKNEMFATALAVNMSLPKRLARSHTFLARSNRFSRALCVNVDFVSAYVDGLCFLCRE
jgi:hypothetical protein